MSEQLDTIWQSFCWSYELGDEIAARGWDPDLANASESRRNFLTARILGAIRNFCAMKVVRQSASESQVFETVAAMWWDHAHCEDLSYGDFELQDAVPEECLDLFFAYASIGAHPSHYMIHVLDREGEDCFLRYCNGCGWFHFRSEESPCDNCEGCSRCCDCSVCSNCGARVSETCSGCQQCDSCCGCTTCEGCQEPASNTCDECSLCSRCCECRTATPRKSIESTDPLLADSPADRVRFNSRRLCGVEWEFNDCASAGPINNWLKEWECGIHTDSSAGRTSGCYGYEAVTRPLAGDHIEKCLLELSSAFKQAKARVNERCGIHVHVDARDFLWPDMLRLLRVYAHIEPVLFAIAGQNRQKNHYCYRTGTHFEKALQSLDRKASVIKLALVDGQDGIADCSDDSARRRMIGKLDKKESGRYRSLNICPWLARYRRSKMRPSNKLTGVLARDATVEFRLHRHSLNGERVVGWTQLCVAIVDWVSNATDKEADAIVGMTSLRALATIAPRHVPWIMKRIREWRAATFVDLSGNGKGDGIYRTVRFREGRWICAA